MAYKKNRNIKSWNYDQSQAKVCGCVDSSGKPKKLYMNEAQAKNAAQHAQLQYGNIVKIYDCPKVRGYHLTSEKQ